MAIDVDWVLSKIDREFTANFHWNFDCNRDSCLVTKFLSRDCAAMGVFELQFVWSKWRIGIRRPSIDCFLLCRFVCRLELL